MTKLNKQFGVDLESGSLTLPEEYAQFYGRGKLVGMNYRNKIESGLVPERVRETARKELEAIGRDIAAMHMEKARGFRERAARRRDDIAQERKFHPEAAMLRLKEAELRVQGMSEAMRMHRAIMAANGQIGLSREEALVLASMIPDTHPTARTFQKYIEDSRFDDPLYGDPESKTLEDLATIAEERGASLEFTRTTAEGKVERGTFTLDSVVDIGE